MPNQQLWASNFPRPRCVTRVRDLAQNLQGRPKEKHQKDYIRKLTTGQSRHTNVPLEGKRLCGIGTGLRVEEGNGPVGSEVESRNSV